MSRRSILAVLAVLAVPTAIVADSIQIDVAGNTATAAIELPNQISLDFTLTFEQVTNLSATNLGLTATLVDPANLALRSRLPQGSTIPAAFPVIVTVEPPAAGGLAFNGVVSIALHTVDLAWSPGTPLRLLAAPLGGAFVDITSSTGSGSYRAGANKGGFSEFLVVADLRTVDAVIADKFDRLQSTLTQNASSIPAALRTDLQSQLDAARSALSAGDPAGAASAIAGLAATVQQHSGTEIPDQWRASRDVVNVAGELRSAAATLSYSLLLKANSGS
jgi:hypothetical protein